MNVERFCHRMSGTALAVLWGVSLAWVPQWAQANVVSGQPLREELRVRMESPIVRELQVRLRHAKYFALYDVDDRFSLRTREGVRKFQEDHGLPPTGVVNQATWSLLLSKSRTPTAADRAVAAEEMGLLRLRLAAEVEHRRVRLVVADEHDQGLAARMRHAGIPERFGPARVGAQRERRLLVVVDISLRRTLRP